MEFLELAYNLAKDMHIPRRSNKKNKSARKYLLLSVYERSS